MKPGRTADDAELRRRAEARLKTQRSDADAQRSPQHTQRLLHELQVHQIELEMQNEELQQTRQKMGVVLAQYADLYDFAPVGYFSLARDGTIRRVNLTGARLLATERSRLENRRFGLFVSEQSRPAFNAFLDAVFAAQAKKTCEISLLKEGNQPFWAHIEATLSEDGQECRAAMSDISARRLAENRLMLTAAVLWLLNSGGEFRHVLGNVLQAIKGSTGVATVGVRLNDGDGDPNYMCEEFSQAFLKTEAERPVRSRNACNAAEYESVTLVPLRSEGQTMGLLHLCDTEEGRFPPDEIKFFESLGDCIGVALGRHQTEALSQQLNAELEHKIFDRTRQNEDQAALLVQKNSTLREMLSQLSREKSAMEQRMIANIDALVVPLVKLLRQTGTPAQCIRLGQLEEVLATVTGTVGASLLTGQTRLSSRELEISALVRIGMTSKEIAVALNISCTTVSTHRKNVRRKLGMVGQGTNLATSLRAP